MGVSGNLACFNTHMWVSGDLACLCPQINVEYVVILTLKLQERPYECSVWDVCIVLVLNAVVYIFIIPKLHFV